MEVSGKIIAVLPVVTGTGAKGEWKKQTAVLETADQYPKKVAFDMFNDKIATFTNGEEVTVHINIDAREWQGKWFNSVTAWKVEKGGTVSHEEPAPTPAAPITQQDTEHLPF